MFLSRTHKKSFNFSHYNDFDFHPVFVPAFCKSCTFERLELKHPMIFFFW